MTENHTPAPWTQGTSLFGQKCVWLDGLEERDGGGYMGPSSTWIDCNTEPNARLIASAPELLAIVQTLLAAVDAVDAGEITGTYLSKDAPLILHARAVVGKATGSVWSATLQESPA